MLKHVITVRKWSSIIR